MKSSTLELLCCPECHGSLSLGNCGGGESDIERGTLICSECERRFPVEGGIPCFLDPRKLEGLNRRFARFYDWFSHVYAFSTRLGFLGFGGERKARKEVLDRLELKGGPVLEVSIGTGANLPFLFESPRAGHICGLDISAGQLARCRKFVAGRGWSVDLFLGTAEALPFRDESFDSVFHIGGINFFSNKKLAIEEMIRVARAGSRIVIADESQKIAENIHRIGGLFRRRRDVEVDLRVPIHLVPETMEEKRVDGIWKAHGEYHGYRLEFRKPAQP